MTTTRIGASSLFFLFFVLVDARADAAPTVAPAAAAPAAKQATAAAGRPPIRPAGASPKLVPVKAAPGVTASIVKKPKKAVTAVEIGKYLSYQGDTPLLRVASGQQFKLEPADMPNMTAAQVAGLKKALPVAMAQKYGTYIAAGQVNLQGVDPQVLKDKTPPAPTTAIPNDAPTQTRPASDHRSNQTPIRNQGARNTCVAHAAVAAIEARYRKEGATPNLSENHAFNRFGEYTGVPCILDQGVPAWKSAEWLTNKQICAESYSPYVPNEQTANCGEASSTCRTYSVHGFTNTFPLFGTEGGAGVASINNTNGLEAWLDQGYDIVGGFYIAGVDWSDGTAESGVIDVQTINLGSAGTVPVGASGGHAMLIVGYDRPGQYFIVKNSWGNGFGHWGYAYLSYDYVRVYAKYGYVVIDVTPRAKQWDE